MAGWFGTPRTKIRTMLHSVLTRRFFFPRMQGMKRRSLLCLFLLSAVTLLLNSCIATDFDRIPRTDFIKNYEKPEEDRFDFCSFWDITTNEGWDERVDHSQKLHLGGVTLQYYQNMPADPKERAKIEELRSYFEQRLRTKFTELAAQDNSLELVDGPGPGVYTVEYALLCAAPARIAKNAALQVPGYLIKGGSIAANLIFGNKEDAGYISFASRLKDDKGTVIAEAADFEYGTESLTGKVLVDTKNFRPYAYQRQSIDHWVDEFGKLFTTRHEVKVKRPKFFLNPF